MRSTLFSPFRKPHGLTNSVPPFPSKNSNPDHPPRPRPRPPPRPLPRAHHPRARRVLQQPPRARRLVRLVRLFRLPRHHPRPRHRHRRHLRRRHTVPPRVGRPAHPRPQRPRCRAGRPPRGRRVARRRRHLDRRRRLGAHPRGHAQAWPRRRRGQAVPDHREVKRQARKKKAEWERKGGRVTDGRSSGAKDASGCSRLY